MVKKVIVIAVSVCLLGLGIACSLVQSSDNINDADSSEKAFVPDIKTTRFIPENADFGSFLAGLEAKRQGDVLSLSRYYQNVLATDGENENAIQTLYLTSALTADYDAVLPYLPYLEQNVQNQLYAPYVQMAAQIKNNDWTVKLPPATPSSVESVLNPLIRAWAAVADERPDKALKILSEMGKNESFKALAKYHQALVYIYKGDKGAAESLLKELARQKQPSLSVLLTIKRFYLNEGRWNQLNPMWQVYEKTALNHQGVLDVLSNNAIAEDVSTPQKGVARAFYDVALAVAGTDSGKEVGAVLNGVALYLNPNSYLYTSLQGEILEKLDMYQAANILYARAKPTTDAMLFKQMLNYTALKDKESARRILLKLAQKNKENVLIESLLGDSYYESGDYQKAVDLYTRALERAGALTNARELSGIYYARGVCFDQLGVQKPAETDLKKAVSLNPNNPEALNYLGYMMLENGLNIDEAGDFIQKALALSPNEPHILDSLGWYYYNKKEYQKALELIELSYEQMPSSAVVADHLGDVYRALNRPLEASYQYKKAWDLGTDLSKRQKKALEAKVSAVKK